MPQLSPINWILLFFSFWMILSINSSIMWWNTNNYYNFIKMNENFMKINFKW